MRKEENLNGKRQTSVKHNNNNQQYFADLAVGRAQYGVQVAQEEGNRQTEAYGDKGPVENLNRRPADNGDRDPNEVGVAVQGPAFEEVG